MNEQKCPNDGSTMRREVKPLTLTYKDQSETADFPGWTCPKCSERVFSGLDLKGSSRIMNRHRARDFGLLDPDEIRRIRKKLGLSQQKAGILIGGGPRAFQKYESSDLLPSLGVNNTLMILDHNPSELAVLEKRLQKTINKMYGHHDRPPA